MAVPSIVVGTDFSEGSRRAVQAVGFLARDAPARLRLVHAFPPGKPRLSGAEARRVKAAVGHAETYEAAQLSTMAERLRRQGFEVETSAVEGKAAATLLAAAKRNKAGLIVIGTTGRNAVKGLFLGSVAQAVLRDSPVPVLVTPARNRKGRRRAGPVLAAVDLGSTSSDIVHAAAGLARDLRVPLHILYAMPLPFMGGGVPDSAMAFTPEVLAADEEEAARQLTQLAEGVRDRIKAKTVIGFGDAATHVLAHAVQASAAAIVLGRRKAGRRLGSVSAAVVRAADRPVVVVPAGFGGKRRTLGFAAAAGSP